MTTDCDTLSALTKSTSAARADAVLKILKASNAPRDHAITAVAISMSECMAMWLQKRSADLPYKLPCYACRTCVGLEGLPVEGILMWQPSMTKDPLVVGALIGAGAIVDAPPNKFTYQGTTYYRVMGGAKEPNGDTLAAFFETMLIHRRASMLSSFSLGPTQMWLAQTKMSQDWQAKYGRKVSGSGLVPSFPQTWDELAAVYFSQTACNVLDATSYLKGTTWPSTQPDNRTVGINFLAGRQTGGTSDPGSSAELYYDKFFKGNLRYCVAAWNAI